MKSRCGADKFLHFSMDAGDCKLLPLYPIRMPFGIVLKCLFCIPQTFDYNLSSSRKRSIV